MFLRLNIDEGAISLDIEPKIKLNTSCNSNLQHRYAMRIIATIIHDPSFLMLFKGTLLDAVAHEMYSVLDTFSRCN